MPFARQRPILFETHRLPALHEDPSEELVEFLSEINAVSERNGGISIVTGAFEAVVAGPGDWVVRGADNISIHNDEQFNRLFELVED